MDCHLPSTGHLLAMVARYSPLWLTLPDLDGGRLGGSAGSTGRVQEAGEVGGQRAGGWEAAQGTTSDAHEVGEPSADTQEVE